MQQVYVASLRPKYDSHVLFVQHQLNIIKTFLIHNLPYIKEDGLYGIETAKAVKAFQQACNITADGKLGPQTIAYMQQKMRELPSISPTPVKSPSTPLKKFSLCTVVDQFVDVVKSFYSTLGNVADDLLKMKNPSSRMVFNCFRGSVEQIDPALKRLQNALFKHKQYMEGRMVSDETKLLAKKNTYKPQISFQERDSIRKASQAISKANTSKRMAAQMLREASSAKDAILNNLKKYDFVSKIATRMKSMGLIGNKVDLKKIPKGIGIAALIYSLKDIIWDIFNISEFFDKSTSEAWVEDLRKDCYAFLDNLIIGCISIFLAKLVVAAGAAGVAAAGGVTLSTGAILVAIGIIALIIGLVFSYVLSLKDISFSRFIYEDCAEFIIGKVCGVSL